MADEKLRLYLAHPTSSRKAIRDWELNIEKRHPRIDLENPFYDNPLNAESVRQLDSGIFREWTSEEASKVVERDLGFMRECDGILGIFDGSSSVGTPMELVYAKEMGKGPRLAICTNGVSNPWIIAHATEGGVFGSYEKFERGIDFLVSRQLKIRGRRHL